MYIPTLNSFYATSFDESPYKPDLYDVFNDTQWLEIRDKVAKNLVSWMNSLPVDPLSNKPIVTSINITSLYDPVAKRKAYKRAKIFIARNKIAFEISKALNKIRNISLAIDDTPVVT